MKLLPLTAAAGLVLNPPVLAANPPRQPNAGELLRNLERLSVLGSVLYIAAHPDDENTRLLAYLANEKMLRTAYLSVTRGEGGQNLIGPEQGVLLGLIRTQELLAARRVDGAEQFFTRARDFGYSKSPEETLSIWGHDGVLADMVWVIRTFKPDLIISRFPTNGRETHGHHTASAQLAVEAFRVAADPAFHPEQVKLAGTWQAKRVLWNRFFFGTAPSKEQLAGLMKLDVGVYNPVLGVSYGEMAAASRSMHKSQGFGAAPSRGPTPEYFELLTGDPARESIFDGLDFSWGRVPEASKIPPLIKKAIDSFKVSSPQEVIPALLLADDALLALPPSLWKTRKQTELISTILSAGGAWLDAFATEFNVVPGGELKVNAAVINRSSAALQLREIRFNDGSKASINKPLPPGEPVQVEHLLRVPTGAVPSNPYWLEEPPEPGTFRVSDPKMIGLPEQPPAFQADFVVGSGDHWFTITREISFKWTDPVAGERYRPTRVVPPVMINPEVTVLMFPDSKDKRLRVTLKAGKPDAAGTLRPEIPNRWSVTPSSIAFKLPKKGDEQEFSFQIRPPPGTDTPMGALKLVAEIDGQKFSRGYQEVEHAHIPIQAIFPDAQVKLVRFNLQTSKRRIGYIPGPGDEVPAALRQVGYQVTFLGDEILRDRPLNDFEAIVIGVRAYNTNARLPFHYQKLMEYVSSGGTLITQYSTRNFLSRVPPEIGPYPFEISQDRVTDESAAVTFEKPTHRVLQKPNKLGAADFEGWVQERGLYFADKWSDRYDAILSMNDPGEPPKKGSLLVAQYGKGAFIYTGLAFFRQLPAGVPGAYRLFANLIAYGR
jgi:LmbE family N-acetylglucosaminyl deacetylase